MIRNNTLRDNTRQQQALMACPEVGWKSRFFPDTLRHETRQHGAVKVWWRALQSCLECS